MQGETPVSIGSPTNSFGEGSMTSFNAPTLGEELLKQFHIKTLVDTGEILIYINGCYRRFGEQFLRREVQRRLGEETTNHKVNEVIEYIRRETVTNRNHFNAQQKLSLLNGVLNLETLSIEPHTPELLTTIQLPVYYEPTADCPTVKRFLAEIVEANDVPLLWEIIANCLQMNGGIQRAVLLIGDGANGKSTFLNLLKAFLGSENCAAASLQSLETNRFAVATLYGKLACIFADLPRQALRSASTFKLLTGGDTIAAEEKFKAPFSFVNKAKLIFSCNQPPQIYDDDTYALWRRWVLISFPNRFTGDRADKNLLGKLTTPTELSGVLNMCLKVLPELRKAGDFSYKLTVDELAEQYLRLSNPVHAFLVDCCEFRNDAWVSMDDLYREFCDYCSERSIPLMTRERFGRQLRNEPRIQSQRQTTGERKYGWQGIALREKPQNQEDDETDFL